MIQRWWAFWTRSSSTGSMPEQHRAEYVARINRVIDFIERNLDQPLSLASLAKEARFSRYHFHRIFAAMVGETLGRFVQRLRVERAALLLVSKPQMSVTEVAITCGFSSSATFARTFKECFGMSATRWRERGCEISKIRKTLSNPRNAAERWDCYIDPQTQNQIWRYEMVKIEVKQQPEHNVAYVRHVGPYGQTELVPKLFAKLKRWVAPRGLLKQDTLHICVAHDSPAITEQDKLRLSVCMTVPEGTEPQGEVGTMKIPGGLYAVASFEIEPPKISEAWQTVMGDWMPQSGYQPDDRLCYEIAHQASVDHPEGKVVLDICVPVKPL